MSSADEPADFFADESFLWRVRIGGYQWANSVENPPRRVLTGGFPGFMRVVLNPGQEGVPPGHVGYREYSPLRTPKLFHTFAATVPTEEGVKAFGDLYGHLGAWKVVPVEGSHLEGGEPLQLWAQAIKAMSLAVALWEAIAENDNDKLRKWLTWNSTSRTWMYINSWPDKTYMVKYMWSDEAHGTGSGDRDIAARFTLQASINNHLRDHVSPVLLWDADRRPAGHVIQIRPKNLLGAMWWQFARAVSQEIRFVPCKVCGKPIEISPEGRRADREFCDVACRQRDHRRKVKEAKQLREEGLTPTEIARRMKTTVAAITNWLTKKK